MAALEFDPIERAGELWAEQVGDATAMRFATSVMRVHQVLLSQFDAVLKPHQITFARYEVLRLLSFSSSGKLPLSKIGERLMVHPTSVTSLIDRLEQQGLVHREHDQRDRRRVLASLTPAGKHVLEAATSALSDVNFGLDALTAEQQDLGYELLRTFREANEDWGSRKA
ncbi:MAG: MarR family transcriptional regulator [Actinomycetales bacterium]|nr:MarR family transcriptional regulator [Actinomycetales bacterium]